MQNRPTPHHVAKRLKKTLIFIISGGVILLFLLMFIIAAVTIKINDDLNTNRLTAVTSIDEILHDKQEFLLPDNTSNILGLLDKNTLVDVVARNQPAVVRVLTVYCADISLTSGNASFNLKDACSAGVGSGSIISSDGYIATNGHVVTLTPKQVLVNSLSSVDDVEKYLDYLVAAGVLTKVSASAILKDVTEDTSDSNEALDGTIKLISNTTVSSKNTDVQYAVQLSNEPVRINRSGNRIAVDLTDTIVKASFVDQDFDPETADQSRKTGQFTSSDVALLKAEGLFPYVRLGTINSIGVGDELTAIGFPAFVDDSISTDKWQTVPSITQGKVTDIISDATSDGRKIINTSVPIAQGESGGPSFNTAGEQIGLNTYTTLECKDLKCFGDGQARDIADLKELLRKNRITLKTGGVTDDWHVGLDAYISGNYTEALVAFGKVQEAYPANYLVSPLSRLARQQIGGSTDTSLSFQARTVTTTIFIVIVGIMFIIITTIIILIVYFTRKHNREATSLNTDISPPTPM